MRRQETENKAASYHTTILPFSHFVTSSGTSPAQMPFVALPPSFSLLPPRLYELVSNR